MQPGYADIIVGLDYGDEGKARITDIKLESGNYSVVARFNGGNNAGHTLILADGSKLVLHSVPSGVLYKNIINYIGSGCVVDPVFVAFTEIPGMPKSIDLTGRLKISTLCTAITPVHILWDRLTGALIGTTGRGIGPAYTDKARRTDGDVLRNIRLADILIDSEQARKTILAHYNKILQLLHFPNNLVMLSAYCLKNGLKFENASQVELVQIFDHHQDMQEQIKNFIDACKDLKRNGFLEPDPLWLTKQVEVGQNVLMEGAQAYGIDVTYGAVPYTTSSSTVASNAYVGGDLSAKFHRKVFGVTKAICSRVGAGPFVGEFGGSESETYCAAKDEKGQVLYPQTKEKAMYNPDELMKSENVLELGIALRMKTGEYGATTGRPRRIGMVDLMRLKSAIHRTGVDELYITKVDCLTHYQSNALFDGQIPVITKYKSYKVEIDHVPVTAHELYRVTPVISRLASFGDISHVRSVADLPSEVRAFVQFVEQFTSCQVAGIGVGPGRDEMVYFPEIQNQATIKLATALTAEPFGGIMELRSWILEVFSLI